MNSSSMVSCCSPSWWNCLPIDLVSFVVQFTSGRVHELDTLSVVSKDFLVAIKVYAKNDWAEVWESEFRHQEPALHESLKRCVDDDSWRMRLCHLFRIKSSAAEEFMPPEHSFYSMIRFRTINATVHDFIICNELTEEGHPVDLGTWSSCVWLCGKQRHRDGVGAPHTEVMFAPFNLPPYMIGAPANGCLSQDDSLLLYSINGKSVSEHKNLNELMETIKSSGEFARWRVILYTRSNEAMLQVIPQQCQFKQLF